MKILLLDDNDEWRGFAEATLHGAGFQVVAPHNLTEYCSSESFSPALSEFDLIIVDVFLESFALVKLLQRINKANCERLTLALASHHTFDTVKTSAQAGIRNIHLKPYNSTILIENVKNALQEVS
jgi:two-component system response regulator GlrR